MRLVFITHTPHLLEEFPLDGTVWKHKDRTPARTHMLSEALQSLGRTVRINLSLWLVATEHSVDEVHRRIQESLQPHVSLDSVGDIFVIEARDFAGSTSQDTVAQCQTICELSSTHLLGGKSAGSKSATTPRLATQDGGMSTREETSDNLPARGCNLPMNNRPIN